MLNPNSRSLYTDALRPPAGYSFDLGLATTYSLDPTTLLTIPIHLALRGRGREDVLLHNHLALLDALRQVTERTTVFSHRGRMQAPRIPHVLYGLLEEMVVEARAPHGGAFHPKVWVLRFADPDGVQSPVLRLLILSRNLTADRSWDLSLTLEGKPTGHNRAENRQLGELVAELPSMAIREVAESRRNHVAELADQLRRTEWELPPGWERIAFHVLGRDARSWLPPSSDELVVISPFCSAEALRGLCATTRRPVALVSRPTTLTEMGEEARALFEKCLILDEQAEVEDGEPVTDHDTAGLHAKAILLRRVWRTHLFVGSANATSASLLAQEPARRRAGKNLEVLAELVGKTSLVGGIEKLLGEGGFQDVLVDFECAGEEAEEDESTRAAEAALETAREALANAPLRLRAVPGHENPGDPGVWELVLETETPVSLPGVAGAVAWPLTVPEERAVPLVGLSSGAPTSLGCFALESLTGLVAFDLQSEIPGIRMRFALNLLVEGMPDERENAILKLVLRNRDGFLRYLLLLLGGLDARSLPPGGEGGGPGTQSSRWTCGASGCPLLEEMTRAYSREPERLKEVERVIDRLHGSSVDVGIVPPEFMDLWRIFQTAREGRVR